MNLNDRFLASRMARGVLLSAAAVTGMAMAPVPAIANASAAATADMSAPVSTTTAQSGAIVDGDRQFRNLYASWKTLETNKPATAALPTVSIPSRMPVEDGRYSSNFGSRIHPVTGKRRMHKGIDIAAPSGTPIYATADGTVEMAKWYGGYGNYVQIGHGGDMETRFGHMSRLNVRSGQVVKKGELIGWVGSTGRSTGPHLHYEVRIAGEAVDPEPYLSNETFAEAFAEATGTLGSGGPE